MPTTIISECLLDSRNAEFIDLFSETQSLFLFTKTVNDSEIYQLKLENHQHHSGDPYINLSD